MITWENYEEYMMLHADGELTPAEEHALMAFVAQYPELKKELEAYTLTQITPDAEQVYANKDALLKPLPVKRIIALPLWGKYSIAAAVAAIIFITLFRYSTTENKGVEIAGTTTNNTTVQPAAINEPVMPAVPANKLQEKITSDVADNKADVAKAYARNESKSRVKEYTSKKVEVIRNSKEEPVAMAANEKVMIHTLPVTTSKIIIPGNADVVANEIKDVPAYALQPVEAEEKRSFWDKLPIDDMKKAKMEHIADAVADAYKDVNTAKEELYARSISVKVEKRKLMISF